MFDIPHGGIEDVRRLSVMQISDDVTTRLAQIYDDLPPVFQMFCKILAVSNRSGCYKLSRRIMWEAINDIVAEGVDAHLMGVILKEMEDMCLLTIREEDGESVLIFQSPMLADIALDVCTPVQIDCIAEALIERLDTKTNPSFNVLLLAAELQGRRFNPDREEFNRLLQRAGHILQKECINMNECEQRRWDERIQYMARSDFGDSISEIIVDGKLHSELSISVASDFNLKLLQIYRAPIALGPMGHSLSCICRNTFLEMTAFDGSTDSVVVEQLRRATRSASARYLNEVLVLEDFLASVGLHVAGEALEKEQCIIKEICRDADSADAVRAKAAMLLHDYVPIVCNRVKRVGSMIQKVRADNCTLPDSLRDAPPMFSRAYEALHLNSTSERTDAAQDSIMVLATHNYKPKPISEQLPVLHYQTVARLRNRVLSRTTDAEFVLFRHEHSVDDLEAFLIVTPLLYKAQEDGRC